MIITNKKIVVFLVGTLLFVSFLCPYYQFGMNKMDIKFSLTCFLAATVLVFMNLSMSITKSFINLLILLYFIDFTILNVLYLHCYWEEFNRIVCFLLFVRLTTVGGYYFSDNKIPKLIIRISALAMLFSLLLYAFRIEELSFAGNISYRMQGHFVDNRLTYVFNHKSGYGLILILLLCYALKHPSLFKNKKWYYMYLGMTIITIGVTGSSTSWLATIIAILFHFFSEMHRKISVKRALIFLVLLVGIPVAAYMLYDFLLQGRNLSTGGSRFMIWNVALEYFKSHSVGLGHNFYTIMFESGMRENINNFHNVFLNEMLHFSILNGLLYAGIILSIIIKCFKNNKFTIFEGMGIWIPVLMLLMIDNSLIVNNLPIFIILVYFIFFGYRNKKIT